MNTTKTIKTGRIVPSKTNRKSFDQGALEELAESIRRQGILQTPMVRPAGPDRYELVYGERRWRAAKIAGLTEIECDVRELSDEEAREIQIIENLHREDVDPLEEAAGYKELLGLRGEGSEEPRYTITKIAERIHKSRGYVIQRLLLIHAPRPLAAALRAGKVSAKVAEAVCAVCDRDGREAVAKAAIAQGLNVDQVRDIVRRDYQRSLKGAPFMREDAELVPSAGACVDCPYMVGPDGDRAAPGDSRALCGSPRCFEAKVLALWTREASVYEKKGHAPVDGREVFTPQGGVSYDSSFLRYDAPPPVDMLKSNADYDQMPTWAEMLPGFAYRVAMNPKTYKIERLIGIGEALTGAVSAGKGAKFREAVLRRYGAIAERREVGGGDAEASTEVAEGAAEAQRGAAPEAMMDAAKRVDAFAKKGYPKACEFTHSVSAACGRVLWAILTVAMRNNLVRWGLLTKGEAARMAEGFALTPERFAPVFYAAFASDVPNPEDRLQLLEEFAVTVRSDNEPDSVEAVIVEGEDDPLAWALICGDEGSEFAFYSEGTGWINANDEVVCEERSVLGVRVPEHPPAYRPIYYDELPEEDDTEVEVQLLDGRIVGPVPVSEAKLLTVVAWDYATTEVE